MPDTLRRLKAQTTTRCPFCTRVVLHTQIKSCQECHSVCCVRCAEDVADVDAAGRPSGWHRRVCPACAVVATEGAAS